MNNSLQNTQNQVSKGSIQDVANQTDQPLSEVFLDAKYVAIIDISASMDFRDAFGEGVISIRRFDAAVQALNGLQASMPGRWIIIEFSSKHQIVPSGSLHSPSSMTDLASVLRYAKDFNGMGLKFYLISDGEPDSGPLALKVAREWTDPINVICVGGAIGSKFMNKLAETTSGIKTDIKQLSAKELESTLKLLSQ